MCRCGEDVIGMAHGIVHVSKMRERHKGTAKKKEKTERKKGENNRIQ